MTVQRSAVQEMLGTSKPPIAVGFFDTPPEGVERWSGGAVPAGCRFWREAMEGRSFYTAPSDHYNCAVGSYTHSIPLPPERAGELEDAVGFMVKNSYVQMSEVPGIPTLPKSPGYVAYGPVYANSFKPDVVLVTARPSQAMLLYEAAVRAGAASGLMQTLGRPGCAVLPLSMKTDAAALSFGCKGNRMYTGLPDDEMYFSVPGDKWEAVVEALATIAKANEAMQSCYAEREAAVNSR